MAAQTHDASPADGTAVFTWQRGGACERAPDGSMPLDDAPYNRHTLT
jgi:hypothetical protein